MIILAGLIGAIVGSVLFLSFDRVLLSVLGGGAVAGVVVTVLFTMSGHPTNDPVDWVGAMVVGGLVAFVGAQLMRHLKKGESKKPDRPE